MDEIDDDDYVMMDTCPRCCETVKDEEIYSCEVCDKLVCALCIDEHMKKHKGFNKND